MITDKNLITPPTCAEASVFYLIYTSKSIKLMTDDALALILEQSRLNNAPDEITGMLLYMESRFLDRMEGRFIQLLEGMEADVKNLYERICADNRHRGILMLATGYRENRSFPNWSMGFRSVDEQTLKLIPGFFQLDDGFLTNDLLLPDGLLNYFRTFYEINQVDGLAKDFNK